MPGNPPFLWGCRLIGGVLSRKTSRLSHAKEAVRADKKTLPLPSEKAALGAAAGWDGYRFESLCYQGAPFNLAQAPCVSSRSNSGRIYSELADSVCISLHLTSASLGSVLQVGRSLQTSRAELATAAMETTLSYDGITSKKTTAHAVPAWVESGACYFITINSQPRGIAQLTKRDVSKGIFESIDQLHKNGIWYCHLCLLMPDHLHALIAFSPNEIMKDRIARFKSYQARNYGILWQDGFFDHRIRSDVEYQEKATYIRQNPVRAGFCTNTANWTYVWEPTHEGS